MLGVRAKAPSRIDLSGGTLDIWPLNLALPLPAVTVNVALDVPAHATLRPAKDGDPAIHLRSEDLGLEAHYADLDALGAAAESGACPLPLLSEALRALEPDTGLTLTTRAAGPAGAGLGGSSALLAAVVGAMARSRGLALDRREIQRIGQDVETRLLGKPTGYQDYYPPLYGGCLALEGAVGGLRIERLPVDLEELAARLRLVYTGAPHVSGDTNWGVYRAYFDGEPETVAAIQELAAISREMRRALREGDLDAGLDLVIADGAVRRRMAPGVTTPAIEALDRAARAAGARGISVCGAGGGGCVLVVLEADAQPAAIEGGIDAAIDAAIAESEGEPLPVRLVEEGLRVELL